MLVFLTMIVMDMGRSDERLQLGDGRGNATTDVRVARVQTNPHVFEVADAQDLHQVGRFGYLVGEVFQQKLYPQRPGKGLQVLNRCHGMLERPWAPSVL